MKTVTTTREFDAEGRMVRETVVETNQPDYYVPISRGCTCGTPTWCALHGYRQWIYPTWPGQTITVTCGTGTTVNSTAVEATLEQFAAELETLARHGN